MEYNFKKVGTYLSYDGVSIDVRSKYEIPLYLSFSTPLQPGFYASANLGLNFGAYNKENSEVQYSGTDSTGYRNVSLKLSTSKKPAISFKFGLELGYKFRNSSKLVFGASRSEFSGGYYKMEVIHDENNMPDNNFGSVHLNENREYSLDYAYYYASYYFPINALKGEERREKVKEEKKFKKELAKVKPPARKKVVAGLLMIVASPWVLIGGVGIQWDSNNSGVNTLFPFCIESLPLSKSVVFYHAIYLQNYTNWK